MFAVAMGGFALGAQAQIQSAGAAREQRKMERRQRNADIKAYRAEARDNSTDLYGDPQNAKSERRQKKADRNLARSEDKEFEGDSKKAAKYRAKAQKQADKLAKDNQ